MNPIKKEGDKLEGFEGEVFHPSLDIKKEVLLLGFRYIGKNREEKEIFLIAENNGSIGLFPDSYFKSEEKRYFLEKEGRKLAKIEDRWSLRGLRGFVEEYTSGKTTTF